MSKFWSKITSRYADWLQDQPFADISTAERARGGRRYYFYHIRKTGGTSINHAFLSLTGECGATAYERLAKAPGHRLLLNKKIYAGWDARHIQRGNYFYAFSHIPAYELVLPEDTFTISCFRDPVDRVLSHYRMLVEFRDSKISHPCMRVEGEWVSGSLGDFLDRIPRKHLHNQIYMFSREFDQDQAIARVRGLSHIMYTEEFVGGIFALHEKTGLPLEAFHALQSRDIEFSARDLRKLRGMMAPEYRFIDSVRKLPSAN